MNLWRGFVTTVLRQIATKILLFLKTSAIRDKFQKERGQRETEETIKGKKKIEYDFPVF